MLSSRSAKLAEFKLTKDNQKPNVVQRLIQDGNLKQQRKTGEQLTEQTESHKMSFKPEIGQINCEIAADNKIFKQAKGFVERQ